LKIYFFPVFYTMQWDLRGLEGTAVFTEKYSKSDAQLSYFK